MNANEMSRFVEQYVGALNSNDINAVEKFHSEISVSKSGGQPGSGMRRAQRQQYFRQRQRAFPDSQMTVSKIDVEPRSGRATFEWEVISTHTGHFKGVPPTNRRVTHQGTTELIIRNGKIVSETSYQDMAAFMKQLLAEDSAAQTA
ncbi:MAG: ester cyclase [Pyrinomonadaceae bacterium]